MVHDELVDISIIKHKQQNVKLKFQKNLKFTEIGAFFAKLGHLMPLIMLRHKIMSERVHNVRNLCVRAGFPRPCMLLKSRISRKGV